MHHTAIKVIDPIHIEKFDLDVANTVHAFEHEFHIIQGPDGRFQITTMVYSFINASIYEEDCCGEICRITCKRSFQTTNKSIFIAPSDFNHDPVTLFLAGLRNTYNQTELL